MAQQEVMKDKSDAELAKILADTRAALRTERFAAAGARAKNPNAARAHRMTIARVLTEKSARSIRSQEAAAVAE